MLLNKTEILFKFLRTKSKWRTVVLHFLMDFHPYSMDYLCPLFPIWVHSVLYLSNSISLSRTSPCCFSSKLSWFEPFLKVFPLSITLCKAVGHFSWQLKALVMPRHFLLPCSRASRQSCLTFANWKKFAKITHWQPQKWVDCLVMVLRGVRRWTHWNIS